MREVTFRTASAYMDQRLPLADGEAIVGASAQEMANGAPLLTLLVAQTVAEADRGVESAQLLEWLDQLDGEALDRRVSDLLQDAGPDETYGALYLKALREAAGGN
jgi:hypothetical protein